MRESDCTAAVRLTQAEGWPHTVDDWVFHLRFGRGWVACDVDGSLIGTALWWPYGRAFGTVGLIVVDREHRGKRIGGQLMKNVLGDADSCVLQLAATTSGLGLYRGCGFLEVGEIGQYQGVAVPTPSVPLPEAEGIKVCEVASKDFESVCQLDASAFGVARIELLAAILEIGAGVLVEKEEQVLGIALVRPSGRGKTIGPLVANDQATAIILVSHLLNREPGFYRLDAPTDATDLTDCLAANGLARVDRGIIMVKGQPPNARTAAQTFGLASQALG